MADSYGDGWNGNTWTATGTTTGTVYGPFTISTGSTASASFSSGDYCFTISCGGGAWQGEVSWDLSDAAGTIVLSGGAPYSGSYGTCTFGCTDANANNYDASAQVDDFIAKGVISMYLSFFPVVVGMVKGLRSPDHMEMDQMRTWNASRSQTFWRLRLPASASFLFTSLKVGIAASLIGAVVAELSLSQDGGLGARMLVGSYYGQTIQIWSALIAAATLAALMVAMIGVVQTVTLKKMGMAS